MEEEKDKGEEREKRGKRGGGRRHEEAGKEYGGFAEKHAEDEN